MISTESTDRHGNTITTLEREILREVESYCLVADDQVGDWRVLTKWVGTGDVQFATLVFDRSQSQYSEQTTPQRYRTEKEAVAGHERIVELLQAVETESQEDVVSRVAQVFRRRSRLSSWF